ncbi:MAG TPA: tRNA preQ1(34) S-adenosylmethionine ribosyltransferase-isomerase QueA [Pirellulales bacterium]|nr:tRNA preQ1(34) S-adenosylmethionine ribosyltransferase-isomerase QueA [Pirellulales bacterium]
MSELSRYDYRLPRELISQRPLAQRADARLMLVDRASQSIEHAHVRDLPTLLSPGDCLVINETRVVPARLVGSRAATGGAWEGLFLAHQPPRLWRILAKTRGKPAVGERITLADRQSRADVSLRLIERQPGGVWIVEVESDEPTYDLLERVGRVPLPHYIRGGDMTDEDRHTYQTVYARQAGSVAAPTAGLHFSERLLADIEAAGVRVCRLVLHVGLDTFRPIAVESLAEHTMHTERGAIDEATVAAIRAARAAGGRVVAVGTTSVRVLETAAASGELAPWSGSTDLFIRPPYQFRAVDALMTNFHLPRTTLLVLVRTFGGDDLLTRAYEEAIRQGYRFYSYGDAMLIS